MGAHTPSFIIELPLSADQNQTHDLRARFEAARNLYNALLGETIRRWKALTQSPEWADARAFPKTQNKQRNYAFQKARELYGFSEYALHHFAATARTSWIAEHIDSATAQALASRAFRAANLMACGKARKVRFKSKGRGLNSVEGKSNKSGLRFLFVNKEITQLSSDGATGGRLIWGKLQITATIDWADPLLAHGLACRIKYVRLVRRKASSAAAKGADCTGHRYYVQLVLEGKPYQKPRNAPGKLTIGLDLGPRTVAIVSPQGEVARLEIFAADLDPQQKKKRRWQRRLDRQRRANNAQNYDEKGRIKPGKKQWKDSGGYRETRRRLQNQERKLAAHRKSLHGKLANEIVRAGNTVKLEKISYRSWQKNFGKSVGMRAPGMFVEQLKRTVERTGGTFVEFPTRTTCLSMMCHRCGTKKKKTLGERYHECECGVVAQRDLYSAFLASQIDEQRQILSITQTDEVWAGVESRLWLVVEELKQRAREGEHFPGSMGLSARARVRPPQSLQIKAGEAVGCHSPSES